MAIKWEVVITTKLVAIRFHAWVKSQPVIFDDLFLSKGNVIRATIFLASSTVTYQMSQIWKGLGQKHVLQAARSEITYKEEKTVAKNQMYIFPESTTVLHKTNKKQRQPNKKITRTYIYVFSGNVRVHPFSSNRLASFHMPINSLCTSVVAFRSTKIN